MRLRTLHFAMIAAPFWIGSAGAATPPPSRPAAFDRMLACRAVAENSARLACYDQAAAAVAGAADRNELVVVDRGQMRKARRSLFGLNLPDLGIFGGGDKDETEPDLVELNTVIARAYQSNYRWNLILEDGARWVQVEARDLPRDPQAGMKIRIRRAAMGSFLANIGDQTAIRIRREN